MYHFLLFNRFTNAVDGTTRDVNIFIIARHSDIHVMYKTTAWCCKTCLYFYTLFHYNAFCYYILLWINIMVWYKFKAHLSLFYNIFYIFIFITNKIWTHRSTTLFIIHIDLCIIFLYVIVTYILRTTFIKIMIYLKKNMWKKVFVDD